MTIDASKRAKIRQALEAAIDIEDDIARVRKIVARLKPYYPNMTATELGEYMAEIMTDDAGALANR